MMVECRWRRCLTALSGVMLTCGPTISRKRSRIFRAETSIALDYSPISRQFFDLITIMPSPGIEGTLRVPNVLRVKQGNWSRRPQAFSAAAAERLMVFEAARCLVMQEQRGCFQTMTILLWYMVDSPHVTSWLKGPLLFATFSLDSLYSITFQLPVPVLCTPRASLRVAGNARQAQGEFDNDACFICRESPHSGE